MTAHTDLEVDADEVHADPQAPTDADDVRSTPESHTSRAARSRDAGIVIATIAVAAVGLAWAVYRSRLNLSNIDGISYLSIARQYADGLFELALNAYWSPLVSWLIAPLLALGVPDVTAFLVVLAVSSILGIAIGAHLVWRVTHGNLWACLLFVIGMGFFSVGNIVHTTPDLLVSTWVIAFVYVLYEVDRRPLDTVRERILAGGALGLAGALGHLTKMYLLPVFVASVALWFLWRVLRTRGTERDVRRAVVPTLATAAVAAAVMALALAPWVAALSVKYDRLMVGSSFAVNIESKFDPGAGQGAEEMVLWSPPNEHAVAFGEDRTPAAATSVVGGEGDTLGELRYYVSERVSAFPYYMTRIGTFAPFAAATVAAVGLAMAFGLISWRRHRVAALAALVWVVYFAGYAGITTAASFGGNTRYYWPLLSLSLLLTAVVVPALWVRLAARGPLLRKALLVALVGLVPFAVFWQHGLARSAPFSVGPGPSGIPQLLREPERSPFEQLADELLDTVIEPGDRLVGNNYRATVRFAYYLDAQAYGRSQQGYDVNDPEFRALLREHDIDWYLMYTPAGLDPTLPPELGDVVLSTEEMLTCDDTASGVLVPCRLDVVAVD